MYLIVFLLSGPAITSGLMALVYLIKFSLHANRSPLMTQRSLAGARVPRNMIVIDTVLWCIFVVSPFVCLDLPSRLYLLRISMKRTWFTVRIVIASDALQSGFP
jgi:hypothetical protein